jgi:hypothetical protein
MEELISRESCCVAGEFGVKVTQDILMQRFRLLPAVVTISLLSSALVAHADDTPAQAAARAALMQQMNQMDTEQGSTNSMTPPATPTNPPTAAQPPASQPPAAQPPISQPTPQFSTNVPVVTPPETGPAGPAEMPEPSELSKPNGTPDTSAPVSAQKANTATAISVPPPSVLTNDAAQYPVNPPLAPLPPPQGETSALTPAPTPAIDDQTHPVAVPASGSEGAWPKPVPSNSAGQPLAPGMTAGPGGASLSRETEGTNSAALEQINAPPLPISPEKQAELQNLLSRYMANQITPVQYQEQRAQIMAEP